MVGEGIETLLSRRQVMPMMPAVAGRSAAHLAAILFPAMLRRLYVARDDDPAGAGAFTTLTGRAVPAGIEVMPLAPRLGDFNADLATFGRERLLARRRVQLRNWDAERSLMRRVGLGEGGLRGVRAGAG